MPTYRYNNPGNIRLINQTDAPFTGEKRPPADPKWREFTSNEYGFRAMFKLIQNYINLWNKDTITAITATYAPAGDGKNNPIKYAADVSKATGIPANQKLSASDKDSLIKIIAAMSQIESGKVPDMTEVKKGWALLGQTGVYAQTDVDSAASSKKKGTNRAAAWGIGLIAIALLFGKGKKRK